MAIALLAACGGTAHAPTPTGSAGAPVTRITFVNEDGAEVALHVEVADSSEERSTGLMFRESMAENQGMLFVFGIDAQHHFYMRNTLIPLSIAFIKIDGTIVEIEDMEPETEDFHSGPEPYRYAIETSQGWFAQNGIVAGSRAIIPPLTPEPLPTASPPTT